LSYGRIRQRVALATKKVPKELEKVIDQQTFTKSAAYNVDKWNFKLVSSFVSVGQIVAAIHYDFFPFLWKWSAFALNEYAKISKPSEVLYLSEFTLPRFYNRLYSLQVSL
jgi:STE24 endopeptidase